MRPRSSISISFLVASSVVCAYHWPEPQFDALEGFIFEATGEAGGRSGALAAQLGNCTRQANDNSSKAAQWIRFAYHDMATHNVDDGTGGLDASLQFELDRPENVGGSLRGTIFDFIEFPNKYVSRADVIAAGVVLASAECNGPLIPYRGGRVDALAAGPPGVPVPEGTLQDHIESFRRQGFTQTEMIALVACGHSVGGIHSDDFPEINTHPLSEGGFSTDNVASFDTTSTLDNTIVSQYLDGTTQNLLVTSPNSTITSDLRIFSSDKNRTMKSISSPQEFSSTCSTLLERMINTVPKNVILTDVISPLPAKVAGVQLSVGIDTLVLNVSLRLLTFNPKREVTMLWENRAGGSCHPSSFCSVVSFQTNDTTIGLTRRMGYSPQKYYFCAHINATKSVSKFWFEVNEGNGKTYILDNNGTGYHIQQDHILFSPRLSVNDQSGSNAFDVVVAARTDTPPSRVYAVVHQRIVGPTDTTVEFAPSTDISPRLGYSFYASKGIPGPDFTFDLFSVTGNATYSEDMRDTFFIDT